MYLRRTSASSMCRSTKGSSGSYTICSSDLMANSLSRSFSIRRLIFFSWHFSQNSFSRLIVSGSAVTGRMFSFRSLFLLLFLEDDLLECFSSFLSSLFFVSAIESIISLSELPCCIICTVGTGNWCWDADILDFFFSAFCLLFVLYSFWECFFVSWKTFSLLCFFWVNWIRSGLYWETSISVFPVDSVSVSVSASLSGGVGGSGGKVKVGEGGTKSLGSGNKSSRLTSSSCCCSNNSGSSSWASWTLRIIFEDCWRSLKC